MYHLTSSSCKCQDHEIQRFNQNIYNIGREDNIFYRKSAGSHFMLYVKNQYCSFDYNACISKKKKQSAPLHRISLQK